MQLVCLFEFQRYDEKENILQFVQTALKFNSFTKTMHGYTLIINLSLFYHHESMD